MSIFINGGKLCPELQSAEKSGISRTITALSQRMRIWMSFIVEIGKVTSEQEILPDRSAE